MNSKLTANRFKVINTNDLKYLVSDANFQDFNRVPNLPANIDEDGTHVLELILYGHNMDSAPVLHHRTRVMVKVRGSMEPVEVILDVDDRNWQSLRAADTMLGQTA